MLRDSLMRRDPFILDDRSTARRLDELRRYCALIPFSASNGDQSADWSQVLGIAENGGKSVAAGTQPLLNRLVRLYESPASADGAMQPEHAFLLVVLGLLESPRALLNAMPARHRDLYYREVLGLTERAAQADSVAVTCALDSSTHQSVLPSGFLFSAGVGVTGAPLHYALAEPLALTHAAVTDVRWVVQDETGNDKRYARILRDDEAGTPWPTRGERLFAKSATTSSDAHSVVQDKEVWVGRVVTSDIFAIEGGSRTWTLIFAGEVSAFDADISMGDQWGPLQVDAGPGNPPSKSVWTIALDAHGGQPKAMTAAHSGVVSSPTVRFKSKDGKPIPSLEKIQLAVENAQGVRCISDLGVALDHGGLPYGKLAPAGATVWLGGAEWWRLGGRLKSISIEPQWRGLPNAALSEWYREQLAKTFSFSTPVEGLNPTGDIPQDWEDWLSFQVKVWLRVGPSKTSLATLSQFSKVTASPPQPVAKLAIPDPRITKVWSGVETHPDDKPMQWPWSLQLELKNSFGQDDYDSHRRTPPTVTPKEQNTTIAVQKLKTDGDGKVLVDGETKLPLIEESQIPVKHTTIELESPEPWNAPYTPSWSAVGVHYTAEEDKTNLDQRELTPFGTADKKTASPAFTDSAQLYLGVQNIEARQPLSLYFQFDHPVKLQMKWEYLAESGEWKAFGATLRDDTDGFARSGGWSVPWPDDAALHTSVMPENRFWIRGSVVQTFYASEIDGVAQLPPFGWLIDVVPNTGLARLLSPKDAYPTHLDDGLPPRTLTSVVVPTAGLQSVEQRWKSYDGRTAETTTRFYARAAARLRHRNRAVTDTDIELLLLEHDPGIREVVVVGSERAGNGSKARVAVIMPHCGDGADPRRPVYYKHRLDALAAWLKQRASPWLEIQCVNPNYVAVPINWDTVYRPGVKSEDGHARVRAALASRFFPWIIGETEPDVAVIGRSIMQADVTATIRNVPEVAQVRSVSINAQSSGDFVLTDRQVGVLDTAT